MISMIIMTIIPIRISPINGSEPLITLASIRAPTISNVNPPNVKNIMMIPMRTAGFVRLIWIISGGVVSAVRFAPQRLQYLRPVLSVPQDGQYMLVNRKS